jgi:hypothetical protein
MAAGKFYWLWLYGAFRHPWGLQDFVGGVLGLLFPLLRKAHPNWEAALGELAWQIPLAILAALFLVRLIASPYWMYQKRHAEAVGSEEDLRKQISDLQAQLNNRVQRGEVSRKLQELHARGYSLRAEIVNSGDDVPSGVYRGQLVTWCQSVFDYLSDNVSGGKAQYVIAIGPVMAATVTGMKSSATYKEKNDLVLDLDEHLTRLLMY